MLRAIYKTGSSIFLKNNRDVDYLYIYDTVQEKRKASKCKPSEDIDKHFIAMPDILRIRLGCYIYPTMELVEGEEIKELKEFNILEHFEEYKELVNYYIDSLINKDKRWYHIAVAYYMFNNNSLSLNEEQIKIIQYIHDNDISEEQKEKIKEYFTR